MLQRPSYGAIVRGRVLAGLGRRHSAYCMLYPRARAIQQQEPCALQIWQLPKLLQQALRGLQALLQAATDEVGAADGSATKPRSAASATPPHMSGPSSAMPGGGGPPAVRYTRILPRLAATPARASTIAVVSSRAVRARSEVVTRYRSATFCLPRAVHQAVPKQTMPAPTRRLARSLPLV